MAAAVGIYFATTSGGSKPKSSASKHTSASSASSSSVSGGTQAAADAAAVKAGCPSSPTANLHKKTYSSAPPLTIDTGATYTADVKTDIGSFTIALDPAAAPIAVNNFVFLAQKGFYNCTSFWRAGAGFMIQGGDPTQQGTGGPGYEFTEAGPAPAANPSDQYPIGSVAMANSNSPATTDPTTNGSQFFVVAGPQGQSLPPDYVLFGHVTSGMNVVDAIALQGGSASSNFTPPKVEHRILKVTISESTGATGSAQSSASSSSAGSSSASS